MLSSFVNRTAAPATGCPSAIMQLSKQTREHAESRLCWEEVSFDGFAEERMILNVSDMGGKGVPKPRSTDAEGVSSGPYSLEPRDNSQVLVHGA